MVDNVEALCPGLEVKMLVNGAGGGLSPDDEKGDFVVSGSEATCGMDLGPALSGPEGICAVPVKRDGWLDFNTGVRNASADFERRETSPDEPMLMYFSSGTTGNPKLVMHNSGYALAHVLTAKPWHNVQSDGGIHFTIADTGWGKAVWGKYTGSGSWRHACLRMTSTASLPATCSSLIGDPKITTLCCPPTMYRMIMLEDVDSYDLTSLVHSTTAGEALNPDLFDFWKEHTGLTIYEGFGQTETPLTIANLVNSKPRSGSMGKPVPMYEVAVLDKKTTSRAKRARREKSASKSTLSFLRES